MRRLVLAIALVSLIHSSTSSTEAVAHQAAALSLHPCDVQGVAGGGRCGTFDVYENRTTKAGRRIGLNVLVLPALEPPPDVGAVFWFEGGPGGAATLSAGPVAQQYLKGLRRDHDIVFVDQRGTGKSHPLACGDIGERPDHLDAYFGPLFPIETIRDCRNALQKTADLTQYTTSIAADDLDDVRAALGYRQIDLAGASYGTLAAQIYMRQHADHVRSAFLIGVVTPDFRLPLPFARAAQNALEKMFDDCQADAACHAAFPDVRAEFDAVLARFDRAEHGRVSVTMTDGATAKPRMIALARESYVEHLRALLYSTAGARFVPLIVHRAFLGDFVPFQTMAMRYNLGGPQTSRGMYFSVTCAESAPFIREDEIVRETRGTFLGDRRVRAHLAACAEWPRAEVPRGFTDSVTSAIPMVMFSGEADGSTPPWIATAAVTHFTNGRQILAPHTGHQIDGPCTWDLMQSFFRTPSVSRLDAGCVTSAHRPAFAVDLPAAIAAMPR